MFKKATLFLSGILTFLINDLSAQTLEGGFGLGVSQYKGDLNPNLNPLLTRPGAQVMLRYNFSKAFSVRGEFSMMRLAGNDALSMNPLNKMREFRFYGYLQDWHVNLEYNFLNFRSYGTIFKSDWTPILHVGLGQYRMPVRKFQVGSSISSSEIDSPNFALHYGFGLKKKISENWNISATFSAKRLFDKRYNDSLDGLGYNRLGEAFSDYAPSSILPERFLTPNTNTPDQYFYTGVTLSYVLIGVKCPNPRR